MAVPLKSGEFFVQVHLALVEGRITCVGVDIRSFRDGSLPRPEAFPFPFNPLKIDAVPMADGWLEVTSPVLRSLRTSEVIENAQAPLRAMLRELVQGLDAVGKPTPPALVEKVLGQKPATRPGPKPLLDDVALQEVVAPAYLVGGRQPVQAVRRALQESGLLGSRVTIDQARKAVSAARARGLIPPAKRSRKPSEEPER